MRYKIIATSTDKRVAIKAGEEEYYCVLLNKKAWVGPHVSPMGFMFYEWDEYIQYNSELEKQVMDIIENGEFAPMN